MSQQDCRTVRRQFRQHLRQIRCAYHDIINAGDVQRVAIAAERVNIVGQLQDVGATQNAGSQRRSLRAASPRGPHPTDGARFGRMMGGGDGVRWGWRAVGMVCGGDGARAGWRAVGMARGRDGAAISFEVKRTR